MTMSQISDYSLPRSAVPAEDVLPRASLLIFGTLLAVGARLAWGVSTDVAGILWLFVFMVTVPLLLSWEYVLTAMLALFVFCDQSIWFAAGDVSVETIYERDIVFIKAPELLLWISFLRCLMEGGRKTPLPSAVKVLIVSWSVTIVSGLFSGMIEGTPLRQAFTFSEFRTLLLFMVLIFLLLKKFADRPMFVVRLFCGLVAIKVGFGIVSALIDYPLLWQDSARGYVGTATAFYGADESVAVMLLAFSLASMIWLIDRNRSTMFWVVVMALTGFAILASMRRAGIAAMGIVILTLVLNARRHVRVMVGTFIVIGAALFFWVASEPALVAALPDVVQGIMMRFVGNSQTEMSDIGREWDWVQAWEHIQAHFVFGTGPGTKLALWRTQAYGVSESLSIHQGYLHTWVRFGLLGVVSYTLTFALPIFAYFGRLGRSFGELDWQQRAILSACVGYLAAEFAWTLVTPPFLMNMRQSAMMGIAIFLIFSKSAASPSEMVGAPRSIGSRRASSPEGLAEREGGLPETKKG